jgi:hypothetical protein
MVISVPSVEVTRRSAAWVSNVVVRRSDAVTLTADGGDKLDR